MFFTINDTDTSFVCGVTANSSAATVCPAFSAKKNISQNPIEAVKEHLDEEKKKKHNRTAFAVGGSVIGVSLLVALFNPHISGKLIDKLKMSQQNFKNKFTNSKADTVTGKFYKAVANTIEWITKFISYTNNINSVKDTYYKQFCTEEKAFLHTRNKNKRKLLKGCDKAVRWLLNKPHKILTKWGDNLAKRTVKVNYKKSAKKLNEYEKLIKTYSDKLPATERTKLNDLLVKITEQKEFFDEKNLEDRFLKQEKLMENLNTDIRRQFTNYRKGFTNKYVKSSEHFNKNLSFWAQDILAKDKEIINKNGKEAVDKLFGDKNGSKGLYGEMLEIINPYIKQEESASLRKSLDKCEKVYRKANKSECMEYFDKKRDLVLGSAPTDILTATVGLTVGAIAFASADSKDKRISRVLTGIAPAAAGIGTNIALTSMLFSGTKGMLWGGITGVVISRIGSRLDKIRLKSMGKEIAEDA